MASGLPNNIEGRWYLNGTEVTPTATQLNQMAITWGANVGTALQVAVGSAGAFVTFNGAGGTPSSLTLTNATALPLAGLAETVSHGTYTPTLVNTTNVAASTAYLCQWMRIGNTVTVSGQVDIDPTLGATQTTLNMSLPVASDFASSIQAGGIANTAGVVGNVMSIQADATNNNVALIGLLTDAANRGYAFTFTYLIV